MLNLMVMDVAVESTCTRFYAGINGFGMLYCRSPNLANTHIHPLSLNGTDLVLERGESRINGGASTTRPVHREKLFH